MKTKKVKDENVDFNPYEVDKLSRVPSWLKILLLKYWAAAAACFLLFGISELGLNIYVESDVAAMNVSFRLVIILGVFLAVLMNYIVRVVVRLMYNRRDNTYKYNMVNMKGLKSFFVALAYNMLMSIIIFLVTIRLSDWGLVFDPFGTTKGIGIEPFTVGIIYFVFDNIFVLIKNSFIKLYDKHIYNKQINSKFEFNKEVGD